MLLSSIQDAVLSIVTAQMVFMSFTSRLGDIVHGPALPQVNHTSSESTSKISTAAVKSASTKCTECSIHQLASYCRLHLSLEAQQLSTV